MNIKTTYVRVRLPIWVEEALERANDMAHKEGLLRVPKGDLLYYLYLYYLQFYPQVIEGMVQPCAELFRRDGCCDMDGMSRQKANFGLKWLPSSKYGLPLQILVPSDFIERVEAITRPNYKEYLQPRPWLLAVKLLEVFLSVDSPEHLILQVNKLYRTRSRDIAPVPVNR